MGTAEHARVRGLLEEQLAALGMEVEVQSAVAIHEEWAEKWRGPVAAGTVHNVIGRLPGSRPERPALLLAAHYDSVPESPGAGDDGSGVAVVLETLRALAAGPRLANDIIALFTDGEEAGLLGATAFVEDHSLADRVGLVLDFEARGNRGPVLLFDVGPHAGRWIRHARDARMPAVTSSLFPLLYRLLPNSTDLEVFRRAGLPGLDFAPVLGATAYHTRLDRVDRFEPATLQHEGEAALALARAFGDVALDGPSGPDAVFFSFWPGRIAVLSPSVVRVASVLLVLFVALIVREAVHRGLARPTGLLRAGLGLLGALVLVPLGATLLWALVRLARPEYGFLLLGDVYRPAPYWLAFAAGGLAAIWWWSSRSKASPEARVERALACLVAMAAAAALTAALTPGASYLFLIPAVALLPVAWRRRPPAPGRGTPVALHALGLVPLVYLWAPVTVLAFAGLGLALVGLAIVPVAWLGISTAPLVGAAGPRGRAVVIGAVAALAAGGLLAGLAVNGYEAESPRPDNLVYAWDATRSHAWWLSTDPRSDGWTRHALGLEPGRGRFPEYLPTDPSVSPLLPERLLRNDAPPPAGLDAPAATLVADAVHGDRRRISVRIRSLRRAPLLTLHLSPAVAVSRATLQGHPMTVPSQPFALRYWAPPPEGILLEIEVPAGPSLTLRVTDQSYGLPPFALAELPPRPPDAMPVPFVGFVPDALVVRRTYTL
jgi:hypothetical protein